MFYKKDEFWFFFLEVVSDQSIFVLNEYVKRKKNTITLLVYL
mgnify:CR=1 FL=1